MKIINCKICGQETKYSQYRGMFCKDCDTRAGVIGKLRAEVGKKKEQIDELLADIRDIEKEITALTKLIKNYLSDEEWREIMG